LYEAYIVGIFPRNEQLADKWKKWERGQIAEKEFKSELDEALEKVIKLQTVTGLTYVHDPQIDWHDIFRPFTDLKGIKAGPLTRYFENNTFYKMPIIKEKVKYPKGFITNYTHQDKLPKGKKWIASLPGPYTFYKLSIHKDPETGKATITNIISGAIEDLKNEGYKFIILHEPAIAYYDTIDWELVKQLYREVMKLGIEYRIHLYFGDIRNKIGDLVEVSPHGFSIDVTYTELNSLGNFNVETIVLGAIDAQNTLMENPDDLINKIKRFSKNHDTKIAITPNTDLEYLPYQIAEAKVMLLSEVFRRLRE